MTAVLSWYDKANEYQVLQFDVATVETHALEAEVTEFPVELSDAMTDQVILKPRTLTIEGYVSDKPLPRNTPGEGGYASKDLVLPGAPEYDKQTKKLDIPASPIKTNVAGLVSAGFDALFGGSTEVQIRRISGRRNDQQTVNTYDYGEDSPSRSVEAFQLLKTAWEEKSQLRCITDLEDLEGLVILDLQVPRTVDDGAGATFNLTLKRIVIATAETVSAPKPSVIEGRKSVSSGSKATVPIVDAKPAEKSRSVIKATYGH